MTRELAQTLTKKVLQAAKEPEVTLDLDLRRHGFLRFARNAPTTSGFTHTGSANITAWKGKRTASVSSSVNLADMSEAEATLKRLVAQAEELAALSPEDREYLPLLGPREYVEVNGYDAETAEMPASSRTKAVSDAIETARKQKVIAAGLFENVAATSILANSVGLFAYYPSSVATFSVTARSSDEQGSGYAAISSHKFASLDVKETTTIAAKKAMDSRNGRELKPGAYTTILEPQAVADLISRLDFDARLADEGRSVFTASGGQTRLGEKIFDSRVNIYADPQHPIVPSSPVGPAGYPVVKADLVREGVLKNLTHSRFWASKSKKQPGPYRTNLIMDGETLPLSKIIASTERGILVTRLFYIRMVDPQQALHTGLTRDGTFWIEDGEIKYPIKNFRFNEKSLSHTGRGGGPRHTAARGLRRTLRRLSYAVAGNQGEVFPVHLDFGRRVSAAGNLPADAVTEWGYLAAFDRDRRELGVSKPWLAGGSTTIRAVDGYNGVCQE